MFETFGKQHSFKQFNQAAKPGGGDDPSGYPCFNEDGRTRAFWANRNANQGGQEWTTNWSNFPSYTHPYSDSIYYDQCWVQNLTIGLWHPKSLSIGSYTFTMDIVKGYGNPLTQMLFGPEIQFYSEASAGGHHPTFFGQGYYIQTLPESSDDPSFLPTGDYSNDCAIDWSIIIENEKPKGQATGNC